MKIKNKGKVHPSPSPSSSDGDFLSILKLLPSAILALISILSFEDREALAYMMTRSLKTSPPETQKKPSKKPHSAASGGANGHAPPIFDCDCFECYTTYWSRWDSSLNRELIHQAMEAFEDQLSNGEITTKNSGKGKRREKISRRSSERVVDVPAVAEEAEAEAEVSVAEMVAPTNDDAAPTNDDVAPTSCESMDGNEREGCVHRSPAAVNYRNGLARKVLPDVLGFFNSRLWSLWGPN